MRGRTECHGGDCMVPRHPPHPPRSAPNSAAPLHRPRRPRTLHPPPWMQEARDAQAARPPLGGVGRGAGQGSTPAALRGVQVRPTCSCAWFLPPGVRRTPACTSGHWCGLVPAPPASCLLLRRIPTCPSRLPCCQVQRAEPPGGRLELCRPPRPPQLAPLLGAHVLRLEPGPVRALQPAVPGHVGRVALRAPALGKGIPARAEGEMPGMARGMHHPLL